MSHYLIASIAHFEALKSSFSISLVKFVTFRKILSMISDAIAKFLEEKNFLASNNIKIDFKKRSSLVGLFLKNNNILFIIIDGL